MDEVRCVEDGGEEPESPHRQMVPHPLLCATVSAMVRVLWASPVPPVRSGVSDYTMELLPELVRSGIAVRLAPPPDWVPPAGWTPPPGITVAAAGEREPVAGETLVCHMGNNPYHEWLLPLLRRHGGVVVLHDLVMHHLLVESTVARGSLGAYREALRREYGDVTADALAEGRRWGFTAQRDPFLFPAREFILRHADAVVVHSRWAEREVRREAGGTPVFRVPMGVAEPADADRDVLRLELGADEDEIVVMHLGFLTPAKGLQAVLEGIAAARASGVAVRLVLVGEGDAGGAVETAAEALGVGGFVTWTGWVPVGRMRRLPAAADLGVVIRKPSAGETSAAVLRFLASGTPVAVSALPQFLELPPSVAPRLTPGSEGACLARLLVDSAVSGRPLEALRPGVHRYWRSAHTLETMGDAWVRVLRKVGGNG